MSRLRSWEVSDQFWKLVEPLVPVPQRNPNQTYRRKSGGGRKHMDRRRVFEAIVFVLRTGCQWKALPKKQFGSSSSIHAYFQKWARAGFFEALWRAGLAEYAEMEGIAWKWQSLDSSAVKAPLAQESVGPNPTDRGKKWNQASLVGGRAWGPALARRQRG